MPRIPRRLNAEDRVRRARERVASGFYDRPETLHRILDAKMLDRLRLDLDSVSVGDGNGYRDVVRTVIGSLWSDVFDESQTEVEVGNSGARMDIEFPVRLESRRCDQLFQQWATAYAVTSVIAEVKNTRSKSPIEDVWQLAGNLLVAGRGRLGFLVSRSGFTLPAMKYMAAIARREQFLLLPFSHDDLSELLQQGLKDTEGPSRFLRARKVELLRVA